MDFSGRQSGATAGRGGVMGEPPHCGDLPPAQAPRGPGGRQLLLAGSGRAGAVALALTQHQAADTGTADSTSAELLRAGLAGKSGFRSSK